MGHLLTVESMKFLLGLDEIGAGGLQNALR
jgi:hypothetical protein